jgi:hypothetical protein
MKFILVNDGTPIDSRTCAECSRSFVSGYLKSVSTQRKYCNYDCYVRHERWNLLAPSLVASHEFSFDMLTSFLAASCSYSIVLATAALRVGELVAVESSSDDRRRSR